MMGLNPLSIAAPVLHEMRDRHAIAARIGGSGMKERRTFAHHAYAVKGRADPSKISVDVRHGTRPREAGVRLPR